MDKVYNKASTIVKINMRKKSRRGEKFFAPTNIHNNCYLFFKDALGFLGVFLDLLGEQRTVGEFFFAADFADELDFQVISVDIFLKTKQVRLYSLILVFQAKSRPSSDIAQAAVFLTII